MIQGMYHKRIKGTWITFLFLGLCFLLNLSFPFYFLWWLRSCSFTLLSCSSLCIINHIYEYIMWSQSSIISWKNIELLKEFLEHTDAFSAFPLVFPLVCSSSGSFWPVWRVLVLGILSASSSESKENPSSIPAYTKPLHEKEANAFLQRKNTK